MTELEASLSEYLAKVKTGQEVLVTNRGRPVARIVPVARTEEIPAHLMALERAGLVRIGKGSLPEGFRDRPPRPKDPEGLALRALLAEREEGKRNRACTRQSTRSS